MATTAPLLLIIEDDEETRRFLRATLRAHDFVVVEATTAREGLAQLAGRNPDLVLLDLGLPDAEGMSVVAAVRATHPTPLIVVSARGREQDKVAALDLGADDYLTKPFGVQELLARIRAALRRVAVAQGTLAEPVFQARGVTVDLLRREVRRGSSPIHLTPTEYKLLTALIHQAGRVVTHRQLLRTVWGPNAVEHPHYLRVYMAQLRHKLEWDPTRPRLLTTEPGVGYRLQPGE